MKKTRLLSWFPLVATTVVFTDVSALPQTTTNSVQKPDTKVAAKLVVVPQAPAQTGAKAVQTTIGNTGTLVIPPQFDDAFGFLEERAAVKKGDKWGYIDKTGTLVILPQFDDADLFFEELAAVKKGGKWGYIDKTGTLVIHLQFDWCAMFTEGLAVVKQGGKWGYIDKTGTLISVTPKLYAAVPFSGGLAAVCAKNLKWGFIDKTGTLVISPQFDVPGLFSEGLAVVKKGRKWGFIDKTGTLVLTIPPQFDADPYSFFEGVVAVRVKTDHKVGFIDRTGTLVIPPQFDNARRFSEGLATVEKGNKWGFISR